MITEYSYQTKISGALIDTADSQKNSNGKVPCSSSMHKVLTKIYTARYLDLILEASLK
jgi:hypothetical protein